jgi:hypothetical protein
MNNCNCKLCRRERAANTKLACEIVILICAMALVALLLRYLVND